MTNASFHLIFCSDVTWKRNICCVIPCLHPLYLADPMDGDCGCMHGSMKTSNACYITTGGCVCV